MQSDATVVDLFVRGDWAGGSAFVIYFLVRLLKSDTKIPINIPPRWRFWLALALGVLAGALQKIATGATWRDAIVTGLAGSATAVFVHLGLIDSVRGGRELAIPGVVIPGLPPGPGKPPSITPDPDPAGVEVPTIPAPDKPPKDAA